MIEFLLNNPVQTKKTKCLKQNSANNNVIEINEIPDTGNNNLSIIDDEISIIENDEINKVYSKTQGIVVSGNKEEILHNYIQQISKFPILTQEEEEELFNLYIDKGDRRAGQAIVLSHLRLVVKIAMQYKNFGLDMMDIISEGNLGIMIALKKFDRSKKARFATYAGLWIKAKVQEFILKSWNLVKVGSSAVRKQLLFNFGGIKKLLQIESDTPQQEQDRKIAEYFDLDKREYASIKSSIRTREASLDTPIGSGDDDKNSLSDTISDEDGNFAEKIANNEERLYRQKIFQESLSILDERQKAIIIARYLSDKKSTLEELSKKYNISKERVRQIEENAIKKLKNFATQYDR